MFSFFFRKGLFLGASDGVSFCLCWVMDKQKNPQR